jgi:hypothetical protein
MENGTVLARLPTLDEVANAAVFMASDRASAVTGTIANLTCGSITLSRRSRRKRPSRPRCSSSARSAGSTNPPGRTRLLFLRPSMTSPGSRAGFSSRSNRPQRRRIGRKGRRERRHAPLSDSAGVRPGYLPRSRRGLVSASVRWKTLRFAEGYTEAPASCTLSPSLLSAALRSRPGEHVERRH